MAIYAIQTDRDGDDWPEDPSMRFKFRFRSSDGYECAQTVFPDLKSKGRYARLVKWDEPRYSPKVMDEFDPERSR